MTLDELAIKHNTDKGSQFHNYTRWYERHLGRFVDKDDVVIVEIGIAHSYSLLTWRDYLPKARVIGVDYKPEYCTAAAELGFEVICGAQEDSSICARIVGLRPQIVIDDGGHQAAMQIASFERIFPYLPDGAVYVIEDLHTAFWGWGGNLEPYLHSIASGALDRGVSSFGDLRKDPGAAEKLSLVERHVQSAHFYPSILFVEKNYKG